MYSNVYFWLMLSKNRKAEKCLKIYRLDPVKILSTAGLAWQAALKKTEVKLELLTHVDTL